MADTKIKVNELPTATPTLNDTLLGSNATKEYACKIEDLASLVGGGAGALVIHLIESETPPEWVTEKGLPTGAEYVGYYTDVTPGMIESAMTVGKAILAVGTYEPYEGTETYWAAPFEAMNKISVPPEAGVSFEYQYDLYLKVTDSMPDMIPSPGGISSFDADDCFVLLRVQA